jgi:hypothetical protein
MAIELDEEERCAFEERAAMMEFLGGLTRTEAEALALAEVQKRRLRPPRSIRPSADESKTNAG